jgi:hypothetical protein
MIEHLSSEECKQAFLAQFEDATESDKWMATVWRIKDDGDVVLHRTSCNYPVNLFGESVRLLRNILNQVLGIIPPEPLPRVERFKLRGDNGNGEEK